MKIFKSPCPAFWGMAPPAGRLCRPKKEACQASRDMKIGLLKIKSYFLILILMIGVALISGSCAYNQIDQIPVTPPLVKTDFGKPFPFEAGLLITEQTREQVFQSQAVPDIITQYFWGVLEPYRIPVGQALEEASIQIFSRIFQKIHLIQSLEEGKKYPLIIEPKLLAFDFRLRYSTISHPFSYYEVVIDARSQANVSGSLKIHDRAIWQNSHKTPVIYQRWFDDYQLKKRVGQQASETITQALEELAFQMIEESRKPQAVRGWLEELNPKGR
jgi:hypothetical protein